VLAALLHSERASGEDLAPSSLRPEADEAFATTDVGDVLKRIFGVKPASPPPRAPAGPLPLAFTLLPNIYVTPAAGLALGAAVAGGFRSGPADTTTTSNLFTTLVLTTKNQTIFQLKHVVFTSGNEWMLSGDARYLDMSQNTYGFGTETSPDDAHLQFFRLARLHQRVYRRLVGALYLGVGFELDHHFDIRDEGDAQASPRVAYEGARPTTTSSGLTTQLAVDSRDSAIRPTRGLYAEAGFHAFPRTFGSDRSWQTFHTEGRFYLRVTGTPRHVLAFWAYAWISFGRGPYLDLPSNAWDMFGRTGRGYVQGRFRGQSELYGEVEYRATLTADGFLGAVAFFNLASFSRPPDNHFDGVAPAGGLGMRMMLIKATSTNLALDVAWGERSSGVYFNACETF
jgi:hypothetical protein